MGGTTSNLKLPNDAQELRTLVESQAKELESQAKEISDLRHYVVQLQKLVFGPRSEKSRSLDGNAASEGLLPFSGSPDQIQSRGPGEEAT